VTIGKRESGAWCGCGRPVVRLTPRAAREAFAEPPVRYTNKCEARDPRKKACWTS
jgi:hypothetical protein